MINDKVASNVFRWFVRQLSASNMINSELTSNDFLSLFSFPGISEILKSIELLIFFFLQKTLERLTSDRKSESQN